MINAYSHTEKEKNEEKISNEEKRRKRPKEIKYGGEMLLQRIHNVIKNIWKKKEYQ